MLRLYPALAGVPIEQRWFGRVAMTPDHLPHIHKPEQGLVTAVGCQGRGVGLMTALGTRIAGYLASGDAGLLPFPFRRSGRFHFTASGKSASPRRSPGTARSTHWSADHAARNSLDSFMNVKKT